MADSPANDSLRDARRFDELCDEFEYAHRSGESPRLEDFIGRVPEDQREDLLRLLLPVELELLVCDGALPESSVYEQRLPDYVALVNEIYTRVTPLLAPEHRPSRIPATTTTPRRRPFTTTMIKADVAEVGEESLEREIPIEFGGY